MKQYLATRRPASAVGLHAVGLHAVGLHAIGVHAVAVRAVAVRAGSPAPGDAFFACLIGAMGTRQWPGPPPLGRTKLLTAALTDLPAFKKNDNGLAERVGEEPFAPFP